MYLHRTVEDLITTLTERPWWGFQEQAKLDIRNLDKFHTDFHWNKSFYTTIFSFLNLLMNTLKFHRNEKHNEGKATGLVGYGCYYETGFRIAGNGAMPCLFYIIINDHL